MTPCQKKCSLNDKRTHCRVCRRTLDELRQWTVFNENQKQTIMEELSTRVIDS